MKIVLNETQYVNLQEAIQQKDRMDFGMEHDVYNFHKRPDRVIKVGETKYVNKWVKLFSTYPDLFPKIYKVKVSSQDPEVTNVELERLDTKTFREDFRSLLDVLGQVGYGDGVFNTITRIGSNEERMDDLIDKINEINPEMSGFFIKLHDVVLRVNSLMRMFEVFDIGVKQFGYEVIGNNKEDWNIKCLDK